MNWLRRLLAAVIREELARYQRPLMPDGHYAVLTIHFDNISLSVPYEPWKPKGDLHVGGHWERSQ